MRTEKEMTAAGLSKAVIPPSDADARAELRGLLSQAEADAAVELQRVLELLYFLNEPRVGAVDVSGTPLEVLRRYREFYG